jgi:hypothetical protein
MNHIHYIDGARPGETPNPPPPVPAIPPGTTGSIWSAARLVGVTETTVHRWIASGALKAEHKDGQTLVSFDEVLKLVAAAPVLPDGVCHVSTALAEWRRERPLFAMLRPDDGDGAEEVAP